MHGLWRELVKVSFNLHILRIPYSFHDTVNRQSQVGVVNIQHSMNVVRTVESVDGNVLELVSVIVELVDVTFGFDGDVAFFRQFTADVDFGGQHAEFFIIHQLFQIDAVSVDAATEFTLSVQHEVHGNVAGIGGKLAVGGNLADACTFDKSLHVDVSQSGYYGWHVQLLAFQVFRDKADGLV